MQGHLGAQVDGVREEDMGSYCCELPGEEGGQAGGSRVEVRVFPREEGEDTGEGGEALDTQDDADSEETEDETSDIFEDDLMEESDDLSDPVWSSMSAHQVTVEGAVSRRSSRNSSLAGRAAGLGDVGWVIVLVLVQTIKLS